MNKKQMNDQANLAFEFIDKLYFEVSYLIKEIEGLLKREDEEFLIGRPRGYGITAGGSTGIDSPDWWWYKKFSVFFVPKAIIKMQGGKTFTPLNQKNIKLIYLIINLMDKDLPTPKVGIGVISDIRCQATNYRKFEDATVYYLNHIWDQAKKKPNFEEWEYNDKYMKFFGKFMITDLFDLNETHDIEKKLLTPILEKFREL